VQQIRNWPSIQSHSETTAESELLRAAKRGEPQALRELLQPFERDLYILCYGILSHAQDSEDAVQETFLRALQALPGFRSDSSFRTWILRIGTNVCLDWKRSRRIIPDDHPVAGIPCNRRDSTENEVLNRIRVLDALSHLLPRHRAILIMKEAHRLSIPEIAQTMRWSEKKVHNELYRARKSLAEWRFREMEE
jgi:RNA polymerase sigma-70 factor (ECF subfamily)